MDTESNYLCGIDGSPVVWFGNISVADRDFQNLAIAGLEEYLARCLKCRCEAIIQPTY